MIRIVTVFTTILSLSLTSIWANEWPDASTRVRSYFGRPSLGSFSRGLEFESTGQNISLWDAGDVVWNGQMQVFSGNSSRQLIAVENKNKFRSIYLGVEGRRDLENSLDQGELIGFSSGSRWYFQIYDIARSRIIDPVMLLPYNVLPDINAVPEIYLVRGNLAMKMQDNLEVDHGMWTLALEGNIPVEVSLYWLGEGIKELHFETIVENDGVLFVEATSLLNFKQLYDGENRLVLRDIPLNVGFGILEIHMRYDDGSVYSQSWNLVIRDR